MYPDPMVTTVISRPELYMAELTDRQLTVALWLSQGLTWAECTKRAHFSSKTIWQWHQRPEFVKQIHHFRQTRLQRYEEAFVQNLELALKVSDSVLRGGAVDPLMLKHAEKRIAVLDEIAIARARSEPSAKQEEDDWEL